MMRSTSIACCLLSYGLTASLAAPVAQFDDIGKHVSTPETATSGTTPPEAKLVFTEFQDGSEMIQVATIETPDGPDIATKNVVSAGDGQEYLVLLEEDETDPPAVSRILSKVGASVQGSGVSHIFDNSLFRGFSGPIGTEAADVLRNLSSIKIIEPVQPIARQVVRSREGCPWGLQRISEDGPVKGNLQKLDFRYTFDDDGVMGKGVDIYVLDSGINIDHHAFGGRAKIGFSMDGPGDLTAKSDGDGHGTHAAAIAAGDPFGVATGANVIGVKIMGVESTGSTADALKGLDFVVRQHERRKGEEGFVGSVASLSWSVAQRSRLIDRAVDAAVDAGIHVSIAAGNRGADACSNSPSSQGGDGAEGQGGKAVTVGSVDGFDRVSDFSNTGLCVDVYAPGEAIVSAWVGGPAVVEVQAGTSMACPLVSGLMAYMMVRDGRLAQNPALMKEALKRSSELSGIVLNRASGSRPATQLPVVNNGIPSVLGRRQQQQQQRQRTQPPVSFAFSNSTAS
ncbi:MAG: hypothetical protein M1815_001639 [Lichina confinis]|nr:MAG: hypothetical protein M1815_001639 [Lichina confinis]